MPIERTCPPVFMLKRECIEHGLSLESVAVYAYLAYHIEASHEQIQEHFGIARHHVEFALQELRKHDLITGEDQWPYDLDDVPRHRTPAPTKQRPGFIYVVQSGPHFKIGRTNKLDRRVTQLGIQMPQPVKVVLSAEVRDMVEAERELHELFADKRLNGEWFELSLDDLAFIRSHLT